MPITVAGWEHEHTNILSLGSDRQFICLDCGTVFCVEATGEEDDPKEYPIPAVVPIGKTLADIEKAAIVNAYRHYRTAKKTAEVLKISLRGLHYKLKRYGINRNSRKNKIQLSLKKGDGWYTVTSPHLKGLVSQGKTIPSALRNAADAAKLLEEESSLK